MSQHGVALRSEALHHKALQRKAWHRTAAQNTTPHRMSWHGSVFFWRVNGSSSRELGQSGIAAPWSAPWAPRKAPHKAALLATSPSQSRLGKRASTTTTTGARRTEGLLVAGLPAPGGGRGHLPDRLRGAGAGHLPHRLRGERRVVFILCNGRGAPPRNGRRRSELTKTHMKNPTPGNPVCKNTVRGGVPAIFRTDSGERGE